MMENVQMYVIKVKSIIEEYVHLIVIVIYTRIKTNVLRNALVRTNTTMVGNVYQYVQHLS